MKKSGGPRRRMKTEWISTVVFFGNVSRSILIIRADPINSWDHSCVFSLRRMAHTQSKSPQSSSLLCSLSAVLSILEAKSESKLSGHMTLRLVWLPCWRRVTFVMPLQLLSKSFPCSQHFVPVRCMASQRESSHKCQSRSLLSRLDHFLENRGFVFFYIYCIYCKTVDKSKCLYPAVWCRHKVIYLLYNEVLLDGFF